MRRTGLYTFTFQFEHDLENYLEYKFMRVRKRFKPHVVPHIFHWQPGKPQKKTFRSVGFNKQRLEILNNSIKLMKRQEVSKC